MPTNDLESLIDQLKHTAPKEVAEPVNVTEDNLTAFVLEKAAKLINNGLTTAEELKEAIKQGTDPEEVMAYSDVMKATTAAIEALNKIGLQNKKLKTSIDIKKMDIEARKGLPSSGGGNTNVLICTREEVIKGLLDEVKTSFEKEAGEEPQVLELEN